jgi:hypothetical protein
MKFKNTSQLAVIGIFINYLVWVLYPDACIGLIRKLNTKNTPQLAAIGIFY